MSSWGRLRRLGAVVVCAMSLGALAAPARAADEYVALGDSYSSGVGAQSTNLDLLCLRNTYAYPYLVAQQRPDTMLKFVACGGAVTNDVLTRQIGALSEATDFVTITIGGNDVGFANLILSCTTIGCSSAIASSNAKIATELPAKLDAVYAAIKQRAPNANVVVLGYPRIFRSDLFGGCLGALGVTYSERRQLNALADNLRDAIRGRATAAGFTFQDAIPQFAGHEVCTRAPYLNALTLSLDLYHPTRLGYSAGYAPLVRSAIG